MRKFLLPVIFVLIAVLYSSIVVVSEGTRGIMLRFGKVQRDADNKVAIYTPGLHFKIPFIDNLKALDARIQTLDGQADRFVTVEKKDLLVDSYVKWRINDFGRFFTTTGGGDYAQAANLLRRKNALNSGQDSTAELGIEVLDVRIKQLNLPDEVSSSIYQRMRAERDAVAREHRSQGKEKAAFIQADVDRKVTLIIANAEKTAQELRGEGDATAAKIFADAFGKEPEFYSFIRSLKAYESSFSNSDNLLILKPDSDFFRFMQSPSK